jgi:hypothetical protein
MTLQYTYDSKGRALGVFIPIGEWKRITRKYKDLESQSEEAPPTKQDVLNSIKDGLRGVKLYGEGKIQLKSAQQLLDEL